MNRSPVAALLEHHEKEVQNVNVGQLFQRYFNDWQKFALVGLGALLVQLAVGAIATIVGFIMAGPAIISMIRMDYLGLDYGPGQVLGFMGAMGGIVLVAVIAGLVGMGLANGGMVGSMVAYRRGEDVGLGTFWSYATRHFGKMIGLALIYSVIMLVTALVNIIPVFGQIVFLLWAPTSFITLGIYPAYLIINDGYSIGSAIGKGFEILKSQFGASLLGGVILLLFVAAFFLVSMVPIIGSLAIAIFGQPLVLFFFVERFESEVRPQFVG